MEVQAEHSMDMGELGRAVGVNRPTYDECRAINVIIEPYRLPDHGDESLHRILNSPTNSERSIGSWDPVRRLYAIIGQGGEDLAEPHLKAQEDEAQRRADEEHAARLQEQEIVAQAARLRREEEDSRALVAKGQHVHEEILLTKIGDQNVFIMPQQNIIAAKVL